jgi:ribosomal protein S18 acetylase RimI-like enzyme
MNFNLKEMYRYLISHTLPGFLLLIEIIWSSKAPGYFKFPDEILKNGFVLVLMGYAISTLLGTMIDGIRHFIFDLLIDSCKKHCWYDRSIGISRWFYDKFNYSRKENERIQEGNMEAIKNYSKDVDSIKAYKHFIEFTEQAIWFPYEAYSNIVVAMLLGSIFLFDVHLFWQFWVLYIIFLITLSWEGVLIYKYCCDDQEIFLRVYAKFKVEIVQNIEDVPIELITNIDRDSFPKGWGFPNPKEYFGEILRNGKNIRILLKTGETIVGFLLAVLHNVAMNDLKDDDPLIKEDANRFYIESAAVLPAFQKRGGFSKLFSTFLKVLKEQGIKRISLHARVSNGLSNFIQKKMKVTDIRRIDKWKYYNYEEPTDYIEADIP